ncbi:WS/DGAT/MGAT family O-acyltransferase [Mycobacteroides stephanolepidis]|uniref:WS/DGAT/MGAT family O-acyltransferase n=1 Tax=[Mycobacterium] stephanolepidis TaxID=1520670 RepID=UPI000BBAA968|nr:wax ester/triacylglycerol synthase family O-acyltransferase [[Mycobacterium] stephanolepidis]
MVTRLSALDASFYSREDSSTPMHVGSLAIIRKPRGGFTYEELLALVESRLPQVPRYRQKVKEIGFGLARPVWLDDVDFDVTYHIRRSALPSPGSDGQLQDLVARLTSRPLDRSRPLWEMYLVEGLSKNRLAIYTKTHQALVDGQSALELGQVMFDRTARTPDFGEDIWVPGHEPSANELIAGAVSEWLARPGARLEAVRTAVADAASLTGEIGELGERMVKVVRTAARGAAPRGPLNQRVSRSRRFSVVTTKLADYRRVRAKYDCDVNDVVLAVIAGALRNWLMSRGEPVTTASTIRAMVPMSVYRDGDLDVLAEGAATTEVSPFLVDLPVGEGNTVVRLSQIAHATESHSAAFSLVDVPNMAALSGFVPPTLHALAARVATTLPNRLFNLLVTNVPGPQAPMYLGGARLAEIYPVPPLLRNQVLSIGLTSYNGVVYYGINADRDAMPDADMLPVLITEALDELLEAAQ